MIERAEFCVHKNRTLKAGEAMSGEGAGAAACTGGR